MKILASDYDGTLKHGELVLEEDILAIKRWRKEGNLFVIDTGRSMESILQEVERYQIPVDYYVTNNGGMVFDAKQDEMFSSYLGEIMGLDVIYIAKQVGHVVSYVVNDGFHRHRVVVDQDLVEKRYPELKPDLEEEDLMKLGKYAQLVISMESMEDAAALALRINVHFPGQAVAYANKYVVDVVPYGVSKARGLAFLCESVGAAIEDVYAVGDAGNDIDLITFGLHGACMRSGMAEAKQHARYLCDGVGELINAILP